MANGAMVMDASDMHGGRSRTAVDVDAALDAWLRCYRGTHRRAAREPRRKSGDYTIRLEFPDGVRFPGTGTRAAAAHGLSGTFQLAMGNTADWSALRTYEPGDYLDLPARHAHFGGAKGQTVIQLHGER